jgi:hypothetical protein
MLVLICCLFYHCLHFSDASVRQAKWGASKVRDKLRRDIDSHALAVRNAKLLEITTNFEVILLLVQSPSKSFSTMWVWYMNQMMGTMNEFHRLAI